MEQWLDDELTALHAPPKHPRRRPLLAVCIAVIIGTLTGLLSTIPSIFWLAGLLLFLLPLFLLIQKEYANLLVLLAVLLLSATHARFAVEPRGERSLDGQMTRETEYFRFIAIMSEDARQALPQDPEDIPTATIHARIEGINRDGAWQAAADPIRIILRAPLPDQLPAYGEKWSFQGRVDRRMMRKSGLLPLPENRAIITGDKAVYLSDGHGFFFKTWCLERRRAAREILAAGLQKHPDELGLLQALLLGYREHLPSAMRRDFSITGTIHIFAISGAHVGMVAILLAGLLRALSIPINRWFPFVTAGLLVYILMTGAAVSAIRAFVMSAAFFAAPFLGRRNDSLSALSLAALGILLVAPTQLADLGFILSFTAVLGLLSVQPVFDRWAIRRRQAVLAPVSGSTPPFRLRAQMAGLSSIRYAAVSFSAWISTAPSTAYFFNLFSPVALLLNLVVIPAAFLILLSGVLSLISAAFSSGLSETFNLAALAFIRALLIVIEGGARLPGGHFLVRTPPGLFICTIYLILFAACMAARRLRGALAAGIVLIALLTGAYALHEALQTRITLFSVGDGDAILIKARSTHILLDAGPARQTPLPGKLRREGVNRLDAVLLSHADSDHTGALEQIAATTAITEIRPPALMWQNSTLHKRLEALAIPIRPIQPDETGIWSGGLVWRVLWPASATRSLKSSDEGSLVLRLTRGNTTLLLPSDAPAEVEAELLQTTPEHLPAQILLTAAHGSAAASSAAFLAAVAPQEILLSAQSHPNIQRPDPALLPRLEATGARLWSTAENDEDIVITFRPFGLPPRLHMKP